MSPPRDLSSDTNDQTKEAGQLETLIQVLPYLWPEGRSDLKARVVVAFIALVAAKVVTVITPFAFKYAVDGLTALDGVSGAAALAAIPLGMILAYGFGRIMMIVLTQIRDGLFAKVGQNAVRQLAIKTFRHLHALSLSFHLERRTAACRGSSSAAPRASIRSSGSRCSIRSRP